MAVITLKTILNEKVDYHFFQVTVAQSERDRRCHGLPETTLLGSLLVLSISLHLENKWK